MKGGGVSGVSISSRYSFPLFCPQLSTAYDVSLEPTSLKCGSGFATYQPHPEQDSKINQLTTPNQPNPTQTRSPNTDHKSAPTYLVTQQKPTSRRISVN